MHRFLISAAHKSSGKTTLSIGLCAALRARGLTVQPFKKGPDYIDPLWLSTAAGRGCRNLDFFLSPHDEILRQFSYGHDADVCLVEGNKGLYDGLALDGSNSNAALARLLDLPVILVLDARGQTRGIAPLILGYQAFDPAIRIAGVILNRLGGSRHEAKLRAVVEHYTHVPVLGAVHEDPRLAVVERHLGLMPANEAAQAEQTIAAIAERVAQQVDLERLLAITKTDAVLPPPPPRPVPPSPKIRVAIARDAAFGFYYTDDLEALEDAGAELVPFDTLRDAHLPPCDALLIGGGFPESFLDELSANSSLREEIRSAIAAGMPAYAECGGLMYLARSITWQGKSRPMVGIIPGDILMHDKPVGRGYVLIEPTPDHPWWSGECRPASADSSKKGGARRDAPISASADSSKQGGARRDAPISASADSSKQGGARRDVPISASADFPIIHAHEFHYSEIRGLPADQRYAYRVKRGHGTDGRHDGILCHNLLASYTHLRGTAGCDWPERFIRFVRQCETPAKRRERDGMQGARSAATETYQIDRRGSEYRATQQTARAASFAEVSMYHPDSGDHPMFTLTPAAAQEILSAAAAYQHDDDEIPCLRVAAKLEDGEIVYGMGFDEQREQDTVVESCGVTVLISPLSRDLLADATLDFVELRPGEFQFVFLHPETAPGAGGGCASRSSGCGSCGGGSTGGCS